MPRGKQTADANIGRPMDPPNDCTTFTDFDTRYAQYRGDADLSLLHTKYAMVTALDDHELSDNAWKVGAEERDQLRDAVRFAAHSMVISGGVHFSAARQDSTSNFIEWTATPITSPNLDDKMGRPRGAESHNYQAAV